MRSYKQIQKELNLIKLHLKNSTTPFLAYIEPYSDNKISLLLNFRNNPSKRMIFDNENKCNNYLDRLQNTKDKIVIFNLLEDLLE